MPRLAPVTSAVQSVRSISLSTLPRSPAITSDRWRAHELVSTLMLRTATLALLGLRVAYGAALIAAPERLALRWLGPGRRRGRRPRCRCAGSARARSSSTAPRSPPRCRASRCARSSPPARRATSPTSLATVAGRRGLPDGAAPATVAVAGGSALLTAALAAAVER